MHIDMYKCIHVNGILTKMYTQWYERPSSELLKSPVAVIGLPGIANVGRIAAESLSSIIGARHILDFFSDDFPPRVVVKNGISYFPKSSLYLYKSGPDEPHDVFILTADFQPSSSQGTYVYADFVAKELSSFGVKTICALAAYEQEYGEFFAGYPRAPRTYVSATSQPLLDTITQIDGTTVTLDGVINGANGFIPSWAATMYGMEGACLLGETLGMIKLDYRAAHAVLSVVSKLLDIQLDLGPLRQHVAKVMEFLEWARAELAQRIEREADDRASESYIG